MNLESLGVQWRNIGLTLGGQWGHLGHSPFAVGSLWDDIGVTWAIVLLLWGNIGVTLGGPWGHLDHCPPAVGSLWVQFGLTWPISPSHVGGRGPSTRLVVPSNRQPSI